MFVEVAFPISSYKQFTYQVPNDLKSKIQIGIRVKVPFGKRTIIGIVVSMNNKSEYSGKIKYLKDLVEDIPIMDTHLWALAQWMSKYYFSPVGQVAKAILPKNLSTKYTPPTSTLVSFLSFGKNFSGIKKRAPAQGKVLEFLSKSRETVPVANLKGFVSNPNAICNALFEKKLVHLETISNLPDVTGFTFSPIHKEINFTEDQKRINSALYKKLTANEFSSTLLHGVTGSGKTEIYIELVKKTLAMNKSAILLLPEIALTPQIAGRFRAVFEDNVALWHSKLSASARAWTWKQICTGEFKVVIGARSAVFAPLKNLGTIIIDEEQEHSYKQESPAPRYHTRDIALMRGKLHKAVVILSSATPSLETYYNHLQGKHGYLRLNKRFGGAPYPRVHIVDMMQEVEETGKYQDVISGTLQRKMEERLANDEQVILLQNRRGFAPILRCGDCGYIETCNQCEVAMTYHSHDSCLKCHFCGYESHYITTTCKTCKSINLKLMGIGTQKVEEIIQKTFPNISIARLDVDTTKSGRVLTQTLKKFSTGEIQVLIGTQMIAKGLDFDKATLVGIINGDTGLFLPDFRSGERTFQLIYQAAGRSGRRKAGEVVIQTYNPENPVIKFASRLDQKTYYNIALSERQELNYPPFSWMIRIGIEGKNRELTTSTATKLKQSLSRPIRGLDILGPANCYRERLRRKYRMHIIMKSDKKHDVNGMKLHNYLNHIIQSGHWDKTPSGVSVNIDVNPVSVL